MKWKWIAVSLVTMVAVLPARPQGTPFATGLQAPAKIAFTSHHNLVVAEAGTTADNSGRVSLIDRATGTRRTLIDRLPSALNHAENPPAPSGPSGVAVQDRMVYVTIGSGNSTSIGPLAGTEQVTKDPASPLFATLLSFESSVPLDVTSGGFQLGAQDDEKLSHGTVIVLRNAVGETLTARRVADFPKWTAAPRLDYPENVQAGNPFGVVAQGQTLYVVDASQNVVRRVDANSGATTTLTTFGAMLNPTPVGPPMIDPVPDSIHLRGGNLVVTTLTGFPFPAGGANVLAINPNGGIVTPLVANLTTAIDTAPLGDAPSDPLLVLEFSSDMLAGAPGRLRLATPGVGLKTIADNLPTPTSLVADAGTGEVFITHIFAGTITRVEAASSLPRLTPTAIVPVVASLPGAFGSRFTTRMQLANPYSFSIFGKLLVHPGNTTMPYTLAPFATQTIENLIPSGAGSVDILGEAPAIVTTLSEATSMARLEVPTVRPADAIGAGMRGVLITPADPSRQRFNVGIRTLGAGATITMRAYSASSVVATSTRTFGPDFFQQFGFAELFGAAPAATQTLTFEVTSGSAIVYGATVDNTTGAMSLQLAHAVAE